MRRSHRSLHKSVGLLHAELAPALDDDEPAVDDLLTAARGNGLLAPGSCPRGLSYLRPEQSAGLAILHVLWRQANIEPYVGGAVLAAWPDIQRSVAQSLWFRTDPLAEESDPFMFYCEVAAESIPVPAVDEYIDVVEGCFFVWRRPMIDTLCLGRDLLSGASDHGKDLSGYLEALGKLTQRPNYETVWLGFHDGSAFRSQTDADRLSTTASSNESRRADARCSFEDSYSIKISVNISLSVREMKRRALGLEIVRRGFI